MSVPQSHHDELRLALIRLDLSPSEMQFHYVRAVLDEEDGCVSRAARRMGVHRRTLQRMLNKRGPKPRAEVRV